MSSPDPGGPPQVDHHRQVDERKGDAMAADLPVTELDARYGDPQATPMSWPDAVAALDTAELFWLSTVRADGRPHVTPLLAVWHEGALHFCTGADEQKARNL